MEQKESKQPPQTPKKPKRPAHAEILPEKLDTPKKPKPIFSPATPAIPTPTSPTYDKAFKLTSTIQKQLGEVILISKDHPEQEEEEEEKSEKGNPPTRIWQKEPAPAEKQVNTYKGIIQYLLALLRTTHEYSPLKLAQLKGLTQVLNDIVTLLTLDKAKPEKISKIKKIALLLTNFIENNASPQISENQFKKNSVAFYIKLRFNKSQQIFLTQFLNYLNTPIENNNDTIEAHINCTAQNIQAISKLLFLLEKNENTFQQHFLTFLKQRRSFFDSHLQSLRQLSCLLQKVMETHYVNYMALEHQLTQEEKALTELVQKSDRTKNELAQIRKRLEGKKSSLFSEAIIRLEKMSSNLEHRDIPALENIVSSIKKDLKAEETEVDNIITRQKSFEICKKSSPATENAFNQFQLSLQKNMRQLNSAINEVFNNGEDILTPNEMQPSPHTPKYVSPAPAVESTPNTEIKAFIDGLQAFTANIKAELKAQAKNKKEEKERMAHPQITSPVHELEIPTFDDAFHEFRQQKAILEDYKQQLSEDSAEHAVVQQQIDSITRHIAEGISLLQQNHQLMTNLAHQKKQAEKLSPPKTPFKIFTSLKRGSQTPLSEKKSGFATTPLKTKESADVEADPTGDVALNKKVEMDLVNRFSPLRSTLRKMPVAEHFVLDSAKPSRFDSESVFADKHFGSPGSQDSSFPATQIDEADEDNEVEVNSLPNNNFIIHEVLGDGDCGLTAFGITRQYAHELLCENMQRVKYLLNAAVVEALLTENFQNYLADNGVNFDDEDQIISAYIHFDVKNSQIDHGWSHPAVLQALAEIQGIGLRIWRLDAQGSLIPHRTDEYDYAEHIPVGATQIRDLLFINGNHFNLVEFEENVPQPRPTYLPNQFFAGSEPVQKRARVFYLSADKAINQFREISTCLKDSLRELYRTFATEQRLDLENIHALFNDATASLEKLIEQVNDEDAIHVFQKYIGKISLLNEEAKVLSPKEYLEKAYTTFVGPLEEKQDNRKSASPPRL